MAISLKSIREESYPSSYTRGNTLYLNRKVLHFRWREAEEGGNLTMEADVQGSRAVPYRVQIAYDLPKDEILHYECQCQASRKYSGMCKHCVATALKFREISLQQEQKDTDLAGQISMEHIQQPQKRKMTSTQLTKLIYSYSMREKAQYFQPTVNGKIELEPTLHRTPAAWQVEFRIGAEYKYVVKDIRAFIYAIEKREKAVYGKKLGFIHEKGAFTPFAQKIIDFLQNIISQRDELERLERGSYSLILPKPIRFLNLIQGEMADFLCLMEGKSCMLEDYYSSNSQLTVVSGDPPLSVQLEEEGDSYQMILPQMEVFSSRKAMFVCLGGTAYHCTDAFAGDMEDICGCASHREAVSFQIAKKDMNAFCGTLYPLLQEHVYVKQQEDLEAYMPQQAEIRIYLDMDKDVITCRLEATYGELSYNMLGAFEVEDMYRDIAGESRAVYTARAYFDHTGDKKRLTLSQEQEDKVYQLLSTGIQQLHQVGEVYVSESLKKLAIHRAPRITVGVTLSGGLLNLTVAADKLPFEELEGLLNSYRLRKKYYRLKNGDFLRLEDNSLSAIGELTEGLSLNAKDLKNGEITLPRYRAFYLDQVLGEARDGMEVQRSQSFKSMIRNIKSVDDSDFEVPRELKNILRKYQKVGYRWLCTLESMGFGGILADDMGLGKTIQVIAFLCAKYLEGTESKPSLIVCPASLVYNWERELDTFAPKLKVGVLSGTQEERREMCSQYESCHVLIISYDTLKRDVEDFRKLSFYCEIIDEAQYIKNHMTQAAKAAKTVEAQIKFALTGTPIENRLSELWSIFDYLMPGMLGSYGNFKKEYEIPIVQEQDRIITHRLQRMIKPFVLRRLKRDVLKDLPDKVENVVYTRLEGEQEKLYSARVQNMLEQLGKRTPKEMQTEKLQILAELTRLRQLCCDPGLVYEDYKGPSAKLETCLELIEEAVDGGHKLLLFSQFTTMLEILENRLGKKKIPYYSLTGSTSKEKRAELVERFNRDEVPVFLISLKAGGTGLNLTAATIVIHFDPWWNVAATNQATDRAHRIGQTDVVSVFKLIARGTVEEKILKLQEDKKQLSDEMFSQEGVSVAAWSKEDLMALLQNEN